MKSSYRHTVQRDPAPAFPKWRQTTLSVVPPLIDVRSTPRAGLGAPNGHSMLAGPALWRWRKHALFPRIGGTMNNIQDHWVLKQPCPRKPGAQWPTC